MLRLTELTRATSPVVATVAAVLLIIVGILVIVYPALRGVDRRHWAGAGGRCCARIGIHAGRQARFVTAAAACDCRSTGSRRCSSGAHRMRYRSLMKLTSVVLPGIVLEQERLAPCDG